MKKPNIADKKPIAMNLKKDISYFWCTCGNSNNQPFCDGSHKTTQDYKPHKFTVNKDDTYFLCQCKQTKNPPFCDGCHKKLKDK